MEQILKYRQEIILYEGAAKASVWVVETAN